MAKRAKRKARRKAAKTPRTSKNFDARTLQVMSRREVIDLGKGVRPENAWALLRQLNALRQGRGADPLILLKSVVDGIALMTPAAKDRFLCTYPGFRASKGDESLAVVQGDLRLHAVGEGEEAS